MSHGHGHCCCCVEGSVSFVRDTNAGYVHGCTGYGSYGYTIWQLITEGLNCADLIVAPEQRIWYLTEWDSGASTSTEETWRRLPYGGDDLTITLVANKSTGTPPLGLSLKSLKIASTTRQLELIIDPSDPTRYITTVASGGLATCCQVTVLSPVWKIPSRRFANGTIPDYDITVAGFTGGMSSANGTYRLEFDNGTTVCDDPTFMCDGYQWPSLLFSGDNGSWLMEFELLMSQAPGWMSGIEGTVATLRIWDLARTALQKYLYTEACRDFDSATWSMAPYYWGPPADPVTITSIVEV